MSTLHLSRSEAEQGEFPSLCLRCGAPATQYDKKNFAWHPQWVYILILFGLLPMIIVALVLTKRMTVRAPFCDRHRKHWTSRSRIIGGSLVGLIGLGIAFIFLAAAKVVPNDVSGL